MANMAFDALAIANYFLDKAKAEGKPLTPMALQKMVYFAHGWHLALVGQPLIKQRVAAWEFGPVISAIYREFKEFGKSPITRKATSLDLSEWGDADAGGLKIIEPTVPITQETIETREILDRVWDVYKNFSGVQLSNLTHAGDSPWSQTYQPNVRGLMIDDSLIKSWFQQQARQNVERRQATH
jgi:uncharacterized phage-associated protein